MISGQLAWTTPNEAWRFSLRGRDLTNGTISQNLRPAALGTDANHDRQREVGVGPWSRF
jgi:hypothetical protein